MLKENLSFIIALGAKNGDEGNNGCVFQCVAEILPDVAALIPVLLFLIEEKEEKGEALLFCLLAVGFILFKNVFGHGIVRFQNYFYCLCIND